MRSTYEVRLINACRAALYHAGIFGLYHRIRNRHTLTVLMFHRVLPSDSIAYRRADREFTFSTTGFAACLDFLQKHYHVVGLDRVVEAGKGGAPLPPRSALITFDDGWFDTVAYAYPQLVKRGLPAVLFVATEVLQSENNRWWQDALVELIADPQKATLLAKELGQDSARLHTLTAALAALPEKDRIKLLAKHDLDFKGFQRQMVVPSDFDALDRRFLIVAAHGHTHAPLTEVEDPAKELALSSVLVAALGGNSHAISFPHGAYNKATLSAAHIAGFKWVFSSTPELSLIGNIRSGYVLGRIHVPENSWTCSNGRISAARLATFLFLRPVTRPTIS